MALRESNEKRRTANIELFFSRVLVLFLTKYNKIGEHFKTLFLVKLPTRTVTALRTDTDAFTALIVSLHQKDYALSLTVLF